MTQEVLKLALEVLKAAYVPADLDDQREKAITAIKEALEQTERHELQTKGEHPAPCARHCEANAFQIVIKNLKSKLAQEQEPVAWMCQEYRDDDQFGWRDEILFTPPPNDPNYFRNIVPVYTTPPQRTWVGLTDEEMHDCWDTPLTPYGLQQARAMEAKLKEKNT